MDTVGGREKRQKNVYTGFCPTDAMFILVISILENWHILRRYFDKDNASHTWQNTGVDGAIYYNCNDYFKRLVFRADFLWMSEAKYVYIRYIDAPSAYIYRNRR